MGTDIHIAAEFFADGRWHLADIRPTEDRNYRAFAILADVRNGYGFAGFSTGEVVVPISEPRGLPEDISPELREKIEREVADVDDNQDEDWFWLGEHSFSWVTLKELMDYDLDAPIQVCGYVSTDEAQRYRQSGEVPRSWAAWTPQPGFERIEWQVPLRDSAPLIQTLMDEIKGLGEPEKVRLVFGFDN